MAKAKRLPSGNWNIRVYTGKQDGKLIYKSFTAATKDEVEYQAAKFKAGYTKAPSEKTVRNAIEEYIALSEMLSPTTLYAYNTILEYGFVTIMDLPVDSLTDVIVQTAVNVEARRKPARRGSVISPKTVKNEWGLVSAALKTICNKSFNVRLPKIPRKNSVLPEPQEIITRIKGSEIELPCLLAMWCGMRMSEIRGLTYDDLHGNILSINKVLVDVGSVPTLKHLAKTDMSIRNVLLPDYILGLIPKQKGEYIVPFTSKHIYYHFTKLTEGLDLSFHDLRHIYASVMLNKLNVPEKIVQDSGGWATPTVMKQVYSQSFSQSRIAADEMRDDFFNSLL